MTDYHHKSQFKWRKFYVIPCILSVFLGFKRMYEEHDMHVVQSRYSEKFTVAEANVAPSKTLFEEKKEQEIEEGIRQFFEKDKTKIVIHIGPHKTGTTTIQDVMKSNRKIIESDGYIMPEGNDAPGNHYAALNPSHNVGFSLQVHPRFDVNRESVYKAFSAFLQKSQLEKKNVLLSAEAFDDVNPKHVKMVFNDSFETHIVIVYRRWYEWLKSAFCETLKVNPYLDYNTFITDLNEVKKYKSAIALREAYGSFFENIVIMNYHDEEQPFLEKFFCNEISGLNNTCQHIKNQVEQVHENVGSKSAEFTQLIELSKERNIIKKVVEQEQAEKQIRSFVNSTLNIETKDLPQKCLDDDVLDNIYKYSLNQERTLFPVWFEEQGGEDRFRNDFEKFYETSSCTIVSEAILDDEKWVAFLRSLS